jgi:hypothetical protein
MTAAKLPSRLDAARQAGREALDYLSKAPALDSGSAIEQVGRLGMRLGTAEQALRELLDALDAAETGGEPS